MPLPFAQLHCGFQQDPKRQYCPEPQLALVVHAVPGVEICQPGLAQKFAWSTVVAGLLIVQVKSFEEDGLTGQMETVGAVGERETRIGRAGLAIPVLDGVYVCVTPPVPPL